MSKFLILAAAGVAAALSASPAAAQTRTATGVVTVGRGAVTAVPGRPTVVERKPIRPGDGGDSHLRERLRNACFNEPNPPSPLCRRVFGDQPGAGGRPVG